MCACICEYMVLVWGEFEYEWRLIQDKNDSDWLSGTGGAEIEYWLGTSWQNLTAPILIQMLNLSKVSNHYSHNCSWEESQDVNSPWGCRRQMCLHEVKPGELPMQGVSETLVKSQSNCNWCTSWSDRTVGENIRAEWKPREIQWISLRIGLTCPARCGQLQIHACVW